MPQPFVLSTHGRAEIPHSAERAVLNVAVASEGTNKAAVSDEVVTTAQHVERLLRELSPADNSPEAKEEAPLAHWSKTGLSATSHVPYTYEDKKRLELPRRYNARITFDIRFKKFKEVGAFGTKLSALPHVELSHIGWILTSATHKAHQSQLRKAATRDALEKARDYCDVLGCSNLRPVELNEGNVATTGGGLFGNNGGSLFGRAQPQQQQMHMAYQQQQCAPGAGSGGSDTRDESPLEFTPKEVRMSMDVTIKFEADPSPGGNAGLSSTMTKRPRMAEDGMDMVE